METTETRKNIIENYVNAYNNFDVENMLKDLDEKIVFKNISNGETNLMTNGIEAFKMQAEEAKQLFSRREQKITDLKFSENAAEADISYAGTFAVDLPNGLKAGDEIKLVGKSIFRFRDDKIIEISDIS